MINEEKDSRLEKYLLIVHDIAINLLRQSAEEDYDSVIVEAMRRLYDVVGDADSASLWRYTPDDSDNGGFDRVCACFGDATAEERGIRGDWPEDWVRELVNGNPLTIYTDEQPPDKKTLYPEEISTILIVPMIVHDEFWGFIAMTSRLKLPIPEEGISFITACGLLLVSRIVEHDLRQNISAAQEEVLSANAAKSNFLFSMSHEMRTPLNAIIGMSNIARTTDDPERFARCFEIIDRSSRHLLSLINNVLDLSNIEVGKIELCFEPFDISDMLHGLEDILAIRAADMSQILRFEIDPNLKKIYIGDADKLSQIILNLAGNAIKFTPKGGEVILNFRVSGKREGDSEKELLRFEVIDNGVGIADKERALLFEASEYAGKEIAKKFGGTGLGLAISKGLIDKMGGVLDVESKPGEGSTFFFEMELGLPREEGYRPAEDAAEDEEAYVDINGIKVLLVEDIEINREVFIALLEDRNLEIDEAVNGQEAVDMYEADPEKYDIIVMDVQMPVMDGYEATERIRASGLPRAKTIPIVALTANTLPEDVERGMQSGMDAYVPKPIDFRFMLNTFKRFSGGNR